MFRAAITMLFLAIATSAGAEPTRYILQQDESRVGFSWFFGKDEIRGRMPVSRADVVIDFDRVENSRVSVALDVARARAGFPFASQGMKSPKVLWAAKFPEIYFQSTRVRQNGDGAEIEGNLTVRGVTKPVVLNAQLFRQRGTEAGDRRRMSIYLTGSLSRSEFGASGWSDLAGDEVRFAVLARIRLEE